MTLLGKLQSISQQLRSFLTLRAILVGIALVIVFIALARMTSAYITPAVIRATLAQFGWWAFIAFIAALAGVLVVPIVPASLFQISAGLFFGPFLGLVFVTVADILGASIGFWLARYWGRSFLARYLSPASQSKLENLARRITWREIILLRLLPGPAYPLVSMAAGYASISYARYISASLVGVFPGLVLLVFAGDLVERSPIIAFALIAFLLIGLVIIGQYLNRKISAGTNSDAR
ncbi:MAG TPA: VTT domain-containing protein [Anaerolineae bacterium]